MNAFDAISAFQAVSQLAGALSPSGPSRQAEDRVRAVFDEALESLGNDPRWATIEPVDDSFLARETNWQLIVDETLRLRPPLVANDLDLRRFDSRGMDDCHLAEAFLSAFRSSIARDVQLSTLYAAKHTEAVVESVLGALPGRSEVLDRQLMESRLRMTGRWISVGIGREQAVHMADNPPAEQMARARELALSQGLSVAVAPVGAGKSVLAERVIQVAIDEARTDSQLVPVWLDARNLSNRSLFDQVTERATQLGSPSNPRYCVVVDGLDELDLCRASQLLDESRGFAIVVGGAVLLTTRSLPIGVQQQETIVLDPLDEAAMTALVAATADREIRAWEPSRWPRSVREAARLPIFALLLGVWLRENPTAPTTTGELVEHLVRQALPQAEKTYAEADSWLMRLAVAATERGGAVAVRDLPHVGNLATLSGTGLVELVNNEARFVLALFQEWFAARALLTGMASIEQLTLRPEHLARWRGVLRVLLGLAPTAYVDQVLHALVGVDPGMVGDLVQEGASWSYSQQTMPVLPEPVQCGVMIRDVTVAFSKVLGPLGRLVTPVSADGEVQALGVHASGRRLGIAWLVDRPEGGQVMEVPADLFGPNGTYEPRWTQTLEAAPSNKSYWAWQWAHGSIRKSLSEALKEGVPFLPRGPIADEAAWRAARTLLGNRWTGTPIPVRDLRRCIGQLGVPEDCHFATMSGRSEQPLLALCPKLADLEAVGEELLVPPWPVSDTRPNAGDSWIWNWYTPGQLLARVEAVYRGALRSYGELCSGLFGPLARHFDSQPLFPVLLRFYLRLPGSGYEGRPSGAWHLLPLPFDSTSDVSVIVVNEAPTFEELLAATRCAIRENRPALSEQAFGRVTSTVLDIFGMRPMTNLCYEWLRTDLERIHWAEGGHLSLD